ncbi:hypothetical protein B0A49_08794 [Cryomyces minteri]|uniref:Glycoside hydrolase family 76 protein n=1 Tax=Cryomyces minteri TaxID=331657 RepID=A0A4U0WS87_9PEZI|nr:hypothetical protein B0A49_08794 [Cryomyces minteri]
MVKIAKTAAYLPCLILATHTCAAPAATSSDYLSNALDATNVINNKWYDASTGLWQGLWWNSGNIIATLADIATLDSSQSSSTSRFFANTLQNGAGRGGTGAAGFVNEFYDDEGWWALGWIAAYDVTQQSQYLQAAIDIFADMTNGWNATCGGLWWKKDHSANTAIANELFLSVAAHLANRVPDQKSYYLDWAKAEWQWFHASGLINSRNSINDGIDLSTCKNNGGTTFTYNQGVILGGLVELNKASPDSSYHAIATDIATAAIHGLTDANGILTEPGSKTPDTTGAQFKGVFARNLKFLYKAAPNAEFVTFLKANADSIWAADRDAPTGFIGPD